MDKKSIDVIMTYLKRQAKIDDNVKMGLEGSAKTAKKMAEYIEKRVQILAKGQRSVAIEAASSTDGRCTTTSSRTK